MLERYVSFEHLLFFNSKFSYLFSIVYLLLLIVLFT